MDGRHPGLIALGWWMVAVGAVVWTVLLIADLRRRRDPESGHVRFAEVLYSPGPVRLACLGLIFVGFWVADAL